MRRLGPALLAAVALTAAGCGGGPTFDSPPPEAPDRMRLTSTAFAPGAVIPQRYTCDGDDISPPLRVGNIPPRTEELVLLVEDPDAPGGSFVHWTVFGIPSDETEFPQDGVPSGGRIGENSFGNKRWAGPCPPEGDDPHRYLFLIYALDTPSGLRAGTTPEQVRDKLTRANPLARGRLEGRFGR